MTRPTQLNCACDSRTKRELRAHYVTNLPIQQPFPLKPTGTFADGKNITSETAGPQIRFAAQKRIAREFYQDYKFLFGAQFDELDWPTCV